MSQIEIGSVIGPYRVENLLGQGGMAQVWRAWHQDLHRPEALKVLPPQLAFDRAFVARFLNEARTAARLQHPNIAAIHAVSAADAPQPYFAMELIEGGDLADALDAKGRFSLAEALPILEQIGAALDYAHEQGFIHRDIKPANIMLTGGGLNGGGRVKVVDFGIARAQEEQGGTRMTQAGMILGTPAYMSPEQGGSGAAVSARSDLYSLGVIAYEMLCGAPPFHESAQTSAIAVIMEHIRNPPPNPRALNPDLSPGVAAALMRILAKNPDDRPATAGEFLRELSGQSAPSKREKPAVISAAQTPYAPRKRASRAPLVAGLAAFAGLALIGIAIGRGAFNRGDGTIQMVAPTDSTNSSAEGKTLAPAAAGRVEGKSDLAPDLMGMRESQARAAAQSSGLKLAVTTGDSPDVAAGQVMSQFPAPQRALAPGATLTVRISTGAPQNSEPRVASAPPEARRETQSQTATPDWPSPGAPSYDYPLSQSDLAGKSDEELTIMRNTIYARYGRKFRRNDLQSYFDGQSWYQRNPNFRESLLSSVEKRNASLILEAQQGNFHGE